MNLRRLRAIVRRVIAEIRRDRPSLALLFLAPIVITGLLTFVLREGQTPDIRAVVVAEAPGPADLIAKGAASALASAGMTVLDAPDVATANSMVGDGRATVAIAIPADMQNGGPVTVTTLGLDPGGEAAQLGAIRQALTGAVATATGAITPKVVQATIYGIPTSDLMTRYAPAVVGFFLYFFVYLLTGISFLRERTGGTLERLMATPVTRGEVVAGYAVGFGVFATLQVAVLLLWVLGALHIAAIGPLPEFSIGLGIPIAGSPVLAFLVVLLLAMGAVCLGIFLSTFARTELQVIQFIPIVLVPQFLLSGVLFPVDTLPAILQPLVRLMPLSYAVDGLRQVFIRGADLSERALQYDVLVLALVALLFGVVASLTIRRDVA